MKHFTFCVLLMFVSCSNRNEFGVLKTDAPEGSTLQDEIMKNGVHDLQMAQRNVHLMPSTVQKIIEGTFESVKKSDGSVIEEDAKIQNEEISEKFVSGNVAYFEHTSKRGNRRVQSVHMVSDGDVIWNGQFSGSKELFQEAMNIFKTMEPQNQ